MTRGETDIPVVVTGRRRLAPTIDEFTLAAAHGGALPAFEAGAHIDVETPGGHRRSYSLCAPTAARPRAYTIAVDRRADGEGGSVSMHDRAATGSPVRISSPSTGFDLHPTTRRAVLIAGGVGITAVRGMRRDLQEAGVASTLVYLVRDRSAAAYLDELDAPDVVVHATREHDGRRFDLWPLLADPTDSEVYCCGPAPLMRTVRAMTMHWRPARLHFEDFVGVSAVDPFAQPFTAVWQPTGERVSVGSDHSLLDRLTENGIAVPSSCRSGTCGTCRVRLISGTAQHRDIVLENHERSDRLITCVSRAEREICIGPA